MCFKQKVTDIGVNNIKINTSTIKEHCPLDAPSTAKAEDITTDAVVDGLMSVDPGRQVKSCNSTIHF